MSERYPGGLITKTPVTPSGSYETSTASGVWTLDQQAYWRKLNQWPIAGNIQPDFQFNYVTMLLHGDGTNGAQNNTFLDSSTNNFTITRSRNTTQGSFSPYGSNWSNFFDGTGDYVQTGNATNLALNTGNFTIEGWFNRTGGSNNGLFQLSTTVGGFVASDVDNLAIGVAPTDLTLYANNSTSTSSTVSIPNGTWNHFALVRSGTTTTLYYNGVSVLSLTDSKNYTGTYLVVGGYYSTTYVWNGYISNLRIVKGTAVYTSNFTPPTAPLSAITNTQLLTCQANRFIDSSANAYALTVSGDTSVQRFNPFGASTAYSTSVIGGSAYFDGSGDYLTAPSSAAFDMGSGDFTIEGWFYSTSTAGGSPRVITNRARTGGNCWSIQTDGSKLEVFAQTVTVYSVVGAVRVNTWYHFALERNGANFEFYLNGARVNQVAAVTLSSSSSNVYIGADATYELWSGYIADFRIVKGSAVYSGTTYTIPTAPLTAITNTQLLLNTTNGAIFDNAMMNNLETVGDAQISTSVVKFGTGSIAMDGTGDWLKFVPGANSAFGTGDFTVEGWFYITNNLTDVYFFDTRNASQTSNCWGGGYGLGGTSGRLAFFIGTGSVQTSGSVGSLNTWMHIAFVRASGTLTIYLNGTSVASGSLTDSASTISTLGYIGVRYNLQFEYGGYMDDIRITNGYARYTANFTPPTVAFPNFGPT